MFATRVGKLLHANQVTNITRHGDVELWAVKRVRSLIPSDAMTVGEVVFHSADVVLDAELLAHELAHVAQWRAYGSVGFATRYLFQFAREFLRLAFRGDFRNIMFHAYYNIPLEVEARDTGPE